MADPGRDPQLEARLGEELADAVERANRPQTVPVNVYETENALVVVAPLPGVMPDDVEVVVEADRLRISAAMRTAAPKNYLVHEWHYGPYERTVEIPPGFGGELKGTFGNGQLVVHLGRGAGAGAATRSLHLSQS